MKKLFFSLVSFAFAGIASAQNADTFALARIGQEVDLSNIKNTYVSCGCTVLDTTFHVGRDANSQNTVRHGGHLNGYRTTQYAGRHTRGKLTTSGPWTVSGTTITLTKPCYYLPGTVHIDSGVTMNIPAGTIIYGSHTTFSAFVQLPKSRVYASGTSNSPVIFTSAESTRNRGDWGGVVITGRAPIAGDVTNGAWAGRSGSMSYIEGLDQKRPYLVGGNQEADNSGAYTYVQVNYAGLNVGASGSGNELNSFSLYGVGYNTVMKNLQVAYANDDAIEIFGGAVNVKNMFILNTLDDDLDFDGGYQGTIQNVLVYRLDTASRDVSRSRLAEISNKNNNHPRKTMPVITNVSAFGARAIVGKSYVFKGASSNERSMTGFSIDKNASARIFNSIVHGYDQAFHIDDQNTANNLDSAWGPQFAFNAWNYCVNDMTVGSSVTYFNSANTFPKDNKDNWIRYYQTSNFKGASDNIKNIGYNVTVGQGVYPTISTVKKYATFASDYGFYANALISQGSGFGSNDTLDARVTGLIKDFSFRGILSAEINGMELDPSQDYCSVATPFGGSNNNNSNSNVDFATSGIELNAINPSEGMINVSIEGVVKNQISDVKVFDMSGKLVKTMTVSGDSVKVDGMAVGLYTVVVSSNNAQDSIKVFVK